MKFVGDLLQREQPDAIVCSNDFTAALLIQTLTALRVRLPHDLAIAGFDDVNYATLLAVPLTTIRQPFRDIGQVAVRVMRERLDNADMPARQVLLAGELIVRQSCLRKR